MLFGFRLLNAICLRTFFQPDEYFQALEPAWKIAFGADSGPWMTWVGLWWCCCPERERKRERIVS